MSAQGAGYYDLVGNFHSVSDQAIVAAPEEFTTALDDLKAALDLGMSCLAFFGGLPVPVAQDILRSIEPVQAAIDRTIRGARPAKRRTH